MKSMVHKFLIKIIIKIIMSELSTISANPRYKKHRRCATSSMYSSPKEAAIFGYFGT